MIPSDRRDLKALADWKNGHNRDREWKRKKREHREWKQENRKTDQQKKRDKTGRDPMESELAERD
jgi:hypothetical protein